MAAVMGTMGNVFKFLYSFDCKLSSFLLIRGIMNKMAEEDKYLEYADKSME